VAKAADLEGMSIRPGHARGLTPEDVAGAPPSSRPEPPAPDLRIAAPAQTDRKAAQEGRSTAARAVFHKPAMPMPTQTPKPELMQIGARIPLELGLGLKWLARRQNLDVQTLTAIVIEVGLRAQFGEDWRDQLDDQFKSWRTLKT
jgi:hypothetical protein